MDVVLVLDLLWVIGWSLLCAMGDLEMNDSNLMDIDDALSVNGREIFLDVRKGDLLVKEAGRSAAKRYYDFSDVEMESYMCNGSKKKIWKGKMSTNTRRKCSVKQNVLKNNCFERAMMNINAINEEFKNSAGPSDIEQNRKLRNKRYNERLYAECVNDSEWESALNIDIDCKGYGDISVSEMNKKLCVEGNGKGGITKGKMGINTRQKRSVKSKTCTSETVPSEGSVSGNVQNNSIAKCINIQNHPATNEFNKLFYENAYGRWCDVCYRSWFANDLRKIKTDYVGILEREFAEEDVVGFLLCSTCFACLEEGRIPTLSRSNGFIYPKLPSYLPPLNCISERILALRYPFTEIRRTWRVAGSYKIYGQIINVPVDVSEVVKQLPRDLSDDHVFNVSIKKNIFYKSTYLSGFVQKSTIKEWLAFLIETPLYKKYGVCIDNSFFNASVSDGNDGIELDELDSENDVELLKGQQQTLLWDESKCLELAPGQNKQPLSIIFDVDAEELSFPSIYLGQPRIFKDGVKVTPYMMANSEIRRKDRRGARPDHILYMAMKIMRLRVSEGLHSTFKCVVGIKKFTKKMIEDKAFLENCMEQNLSFFKSIPNSMQYWSTRRKDLFAMLRQLAKPTIFLTMSANEIRWPHLLNILRKLANDGNCNDLQDPLTELSSLERASLVNEDPVTCCIYFEKLISVIMRLLSSKKISLNPFGKYRVTDFFKRVEFQHRGSPHYHMLCWLDNDPKEPVSEHMELTIQMIEELCSVSAIDLPTSYANQVHHHTPTCFKKGDGECRFHIPYWPMETTRVLLPMAKSDGRREQYRKKAAELHKALEIMHFASTDDFLTKNMLTLDLYLNIIRASIKRPMLYYKRSIDEIWTNMFNPWLANALNANMDIQLVVDQFSCASYATEYINKTNRGISDLQHGLILSQQANPNQDFVALLKKLSINMLNAVEMTVQEASWYLLRQAMSEASREIKFIPTMWPQERTKSRKKKEQMVLENLDDNSTDIWTQNIVEKYESRPSDLKNICLADFCANYTKIPSTHSYSLRDNPRILRYRNYDITDLLNYKREMVMLYVPFTNEVLDILDKNKFLEIYEEKQEMIIRKRKDYECDIDFEKAVELYRKMNDEYGDEIQNVDESDNLIVTHIQTGSNNDDIEIIMPPLNSIVRQRTNVLSKEEYCYRMRMANIEQRELVLHAVYCIHCPEVDRRSIKLFFTGPAGAGKTVTLKLLMETYNRFIQEHTSSRNAYMACASTGKAAVGINGTTVHSAFKFSKCSHTDGLSQENLQSCRVAFASVKCIIIDEISMISAELLRKINSRLQEISNNYDDPFGDYDIFFCGDLRQLPPVNATPIYKPHRNSITGAYLWQSLDYYSLCQVMRQTDTTFSSILTKIGNGERLSTDEVNKLNARFRTKEWCLENVPQAVRLFHTNKEVENYNNAAFKTQYECLPTDIFSGYSDASQLEIAKQSLKDMPLKKTNNLPGTIRFAMNIPYLVTCNVDVEDGIVNGAIGNLKYLEIDNGHLKRVWLDFGNDVIGSIARIKSKPFVLSQPNILDKSWTPISRRSANFSVDKLVKCRRLNFPLVPAVALTVHKSQGGTYDQIVFEYNKSQDQQLVYVALSRVTSIEGLYLTNVNEDHEFHHKTENMNPKMKDLRTEFTRLNNHRLETISSTIRQKLDSNKFKLLCFNTQSIKAHYKDFETDDILCVPDILALTETWLNDSEKITLRGYRCVTQFKRNEERSGGVAIYEKLNGLARCVNFPIPYSTERAVVNNCADICTVECKIGELSIYIICIYLSCHATKGEVSTYLFQYLKYFSTESKPIFVCGDFNVDLKKPENSYLSHLMQNDLNFNLVSNPNNSTTLGNTCLDLLFVKNAKNIECAEYISYFSYHKPLLFFYDYRQDS